MADWTMQKWAKCGYDRNKDSPEYKKELRNSARCFHKPYIAKVKLTGLHFCRCQYGSITSVNLTQLAPKTAALCETMRNESHWVVQGHSRSPLFLPVESLHATLYKFISYLAPFPSCRGKLDKLSRFWQGVLLSLIRGKPLNSELRNLSQKLETSFYRVVHNFDMLNRFGVYHQWRTDRPMELP